MNTFGKNIRCSIFGESHGECIGITIDGLPTNLTINFSLIKNNLQKRLGIDLISTSRREPEDFKIISGYFDNKTTCAPLTIIIENKDTKSEDYSKGEIRPNHSDYPYFIKYQQANDYRGGGHSSGRLTALLVIIGSICEQILKEKNINIYSHVSQVHNIFDKNLNDIESIKRIKKFEENSFMLCKKVEQKAIKLISETKEKGDSLACKTKTLVEGLPIGLGEPFFDSFESHLSHLLFSIPGVKGVLFGDGEDLITKLGSEQMDELEINNSQVNLLSNHQGGINGGVTNGNIVTFSTIFKAPSSISTHKKSVNLIENKNISLSTIGRHDPIIGIRAIPVINSIAYWTILDLLLESKKYEGIK